MKSLIKRYLTTFLIMICALALALPVLADVNSGLIAHYAFDGDATDSSGNGHDGTIHGTTSFINGVFGQAISADGAGWVVVPHHPQLEFAVNNYTISFWIAWSNFSGEQTIIEKCQGVCGTSHWTISSFPAGGYWRSIHTNGGGIPYHNTPAQYFGLNEFHHVAWTRVGNTFTMFLDGTAVDSFTVSNPVLAADGVDMHMLRRNPTDGRDFNMHGALDEVRIYGRVLTDDEIISLADPQPAVDDDGDGFNADIDCNDNDSSVYPGAPELCDMKDNDCDGTIPQDEVDTDLDGYMVCEGDCNDSDSAINPGEYELPGNVTDENCDGSLGDCDPYADWKNHGQFVRCVAHETDALIELGILTEEEGDALISSAAQSDVGKK